MHPARRTPEWAFGPAREDDLEELLRIHTSAFPDGRGRDARVANFLENPLGGPDRLFVLRDGDRIVAHAFLFALRVALAGRLVPFGGVATVGVAPERRGEGHGAELLARLHARATEEGLLGTFLYAFRQGFYRRFGYGRTGLRAVVDAHPASFSVEPHEAVVRPARGAADHAILEALHADALARGTLGHLRPSGAWARLRAPAAREWVIAERAGRAVGYAWCDRVCAEAHAPVALAIGDLVAADRDGERALLAWIARQRDQVERVVWEQPACDLERLDLVDPDRHRPGTAAIEHPIGTLALGPMVRLSSDVGAFLAGRPWPVDGAVTLGLLGDRGMVQSAWRLEARSGRARIAIADAGGAIDLAGDRAELASLLAGGVPLRDLRRLVLASRADRAVDLDAFFALPPTRAHDAF